MVPKVRELAFAATVAAALFATTAGRGQELPPVPIPVPLGPAPAGPVPASSHLIPAQGQATAPVPQPAPPVGPAVGGPPILMPPPPPEPLPIPAAALAPWMDHVPCPPPGWFMGVELDVVGPHVKNRLVADVPFGNGLIDTIHLPMASLDWTISPRFEAGYRFANNGGQFSAVYRFLTTDGHGTLLDFDLSTLANLRSRLDFNVVDLAYGNGLYAPGPYSDLQWSIGVRLAQAFFDARAEDVFHEVRTSNFFLGAGPLGAIEWWRRLDVRGLAVYSRLEGAVPVGSIHQSYEENIRLGRNSFLSGATSQRQTQAVPTLSFDIGLGWTPQWPHLTRFYFGYHVERWWELGDINDAAADLTTQGLFFKGEFSF